MKFPSKLVVLLSVISYLYCSSEESKAADLQLGNLMNNGITNGFSGMMSSLSPTHNMGTAMSSMTRQNPMNYYRQNAGSSNHVPSVPKVRCTNDQDCVRNTFVGRCLNRTNRYMAGHCQFEVDATTYRESRNDNWGTQQVPTTMYSQTNHSGPNTGRYNNTRNSSSQSVNQNGRYNNTRNSSRNMRYNANNGSVTRNSQKTTCKNDR